MGIYRVYTGYYRVIGKTSLLLLHCCTHPEKMALNGTLESDIMISWKADGTGRLFAFVFFLLAACVCECAGEVGRWEGRTGGICICLLRLAPDARS